MLNVKKLKWAMLNIVVSWSTSFKMGQLVQLKQGLHASCKTSEVLNWAITYT